MTQSIRVPDPVYEQAQREAEREDLSIGAIVREWMEKAEKFEDMEARHR